MNCGQNNFLRGAPTSTQKSFTLVEVMLALFVVSLGVLVVFGLFPSGLRMGMNSVGDTTAGMFATEVFGGLRAGAAGLTDKAVWNDINAFRNNINMRLPPAWSTTGTIDFEQSATEYRPPDSRIGDTGGQEVLIVYKVGNKFDHALRYKLEIKDASGRGPNVKSAALNVAFGRAGMYWNYFYTEFYYYGM